MSDLVSRLLAAIEKTERLARAAGEPNSVSRPENGTIYDDQVSLIVDDRARALAYAGNPEAVLRRCAADRELVALHPQDEELAWLCRLCGGEGQNIDCTYPCDTLRLLARGFGLSVEEETTGE